MTQTRAIGRSAKRLGFLFVTLAMPTMLAGCFHADWQLRVQNDSGQRWYIAVNQDSGFRFVDSIEPGAHGVSLSWSGAPTKEIEVLDASCKQVGRFEATDSPTFTVATVPGLIGVVQKPGGIDVGGISVGGLSDTPVGITQSEECGAAYYE